MLSRIYTEKIESWFYKEKVIILYGARQVGKTTILNIIKSKYENMLILTSENNAVKEVLESKNINRIKLLFGQAKIVAIDEAQKIDNIGEILKFIHDEKLGLQIIATGSSSFDLSNKVSEALTGRNIKFIISPLSIEELIINKTGLWLIENLNHLMVFGQYPEIINANIADKSILLNHLSSDYLYQDVLQIEKLRNAGEINKLLKALALQIGSEVSYNEIGQTIGMAPQTVEKYIELLEKNFIIYTLNSLSKNMRNELKKSKKIYFCDLGIRNALLNNFTDFDNRMDNGALWENFCINERLKHNQIHQKHKNIYFWRTYDQAEIDLIEESNGNLTIFEFKLNPKKSKIKFPNSFLSNYPVKEMYVIHKNNFDELIQIE
jgi:uncharacterized protein